MTSPPHIFGIRHHGPGSALALNQALAELQPDVILVEGPPDANDMLHWLGHPELEPPVALIIYRPDVPKRATYYPFAVFSPELQAVRFALQHKIPVKFMDLPQAYLLGIKENIQIPEVDVLQQLAKTAGYPTYEAWWNKLIEQRQNTDDMFEAILEIMTVVREAMEQTEAKKTDEEDRTATQLAEQREAYMRRCIRQAQAHGHQRVAVVCGALHGPALKQMDNASKDNALLANLPMVSVEAAWVPWTYSRLSYMTGYGAGIASPGWYHHLWEMGQRQASPTESSIHWLTHIANLLRDDGLDASSAHIIEAVRLAEALAAIRDQAIPGLAELNEATQTVLCFGDATPLRLIQKKIIVSERMGAVPADTPMVPLQRDLQREQKRLRLRPQPEKSTLNLDLRNETHLERSHLLHRLTLLNIPWGKPVSVRGRKGTFREVWHLQWQPDFAIRVIEASLWGLTIHEAATNYSQEQADQAPNLPTLTKLLNQIILAELPEAITHLMARIEEEAALSSDIPLMMDALPPLAQVLRYGSVRQLDKKIIQHVVDGLLTRICVGLPSTCQAVDDQAAAELYTRLIAVQGVVSTLQNKAHEEMWVGVLQKMMTQKGLHGLLAGRACRLLLDRKVLNTKEATTRLESALSIQTLTRTDQEQLLQIAFWIEGFLKGSGLLLVHDQTLWQLIDEWVDQLDGEQFLSILPLLRRTFATFSNSARQQMRERTTARPVILEKPMTPEVTFDKEQADAALPLVAQLLGLEEGN